MKSSFLETIKSSDGKLFHLSYHQERFERVLKSLGLEHFPNLLDYLDPPKDGLYRCRVVYTKDSIEVSYFRYKKRDIQTLKLLIDNDIEYSLKYQDRSAIEYLSEQKESCDDILIVKNSLITDTSIANVAFYKDGVWFTPKEPLLKGTTRARLLKEMKIVEKDISIDEIYTFEQIALFNAMIDFDIICVNNIEEVIC